ncbi:hypothetical protein DFJ63DRAFT_206885 [Scheffersomyces coipomensis]|uniref:uncharacterized protein n=1 Tax=Scheffersomyces coipomensis TaxID=1788519 RepID=UPI00315CA04F
MELSTAKSTTPTTTPTDPDAEYLNQHPVNNQPQILSSPLQKLQEQVANAKSNLSSPSRSNHNSQDDIIDHNPIISDPIHHHHHHQDEEEPYHDSSIEEINNMNRPIHNIINNNPIAYSQDRESIYSFDSVSTNGRLLDRLDIENEDILEDEYGLTKRESRSSLHSTTRLFEKLDLENNNNINNINENKLRRANTSSINPHRIPNANNLTSIRELKSSRSIHTSKPSQIHSKSNSVHVKHIPMNIVFQNTNNSVGSFKSDIASIKKVGSASSTSLAAINQNQPPLPTQPLPDLLNSKAYSNSTLLLNSNKPEMLHQSYWQGSSSGSNSDLSDSQPMQMSNSQGSNRSGLARTPSAPVIRNREMTKAATDPALPTFSTTPESSPRRILSEGSSSAGSTPTSKSLSQFQTSPSSDHLSASQRTKLALQLRSLGKHREASYQLQIAANTPFNFPQAMYLYALALRSGQGVKQNDVHAIKWLCKCIMSHSSHLQNASSASVSSFMDKLHQSNSQILVGSIVKNLDNTVDKDYYKNGSDPNLLCDLFSKLSKAQIAKVITVTKNQSDTLALCYHELGNCLMNGYGLEARDEISGIKCFAKAGSLGHIPSMISLGEAWSNKTKYHKKDLFQAAAWLRLGEIFGVKSIGNSWIYKEKYVSQKSV